MLKKLWFKYNFEGCILDKNQTNRNIYVIESTNLESAILKLEGDLAAIPVAKFEVRILSLLEA